MSNTDLQGALEENILTALVWNDSLAPMISMRLDHTLFSTKTYQRIAQVGIEHLQRYHRPARAHIADLLERDLRRSDDSGLLMRDTLSAMANLHGELQTGYVSAELDSFIEWRQMTIAVEHASDALQAKKMDQARDILFNSTAKTPDRPGIYFHDTNRSLGFLDTKDEDYFSSGIDALDALGVRPSRRTMTLLLASAKKGKSFYLTNVGKHALMNGRSVLHVTLENSDALTAQRYVMAFYSMTTEQVKTLRVPIFKRDERGRCVGLEFQIIDAEVLDSERKSDLAKRMRVFAKKPPLLIKEFPTSTLTVAQLDAYLDSLARLENFRPDMLLLDMAELMALDSRNLRLDTGVLYRQLRGLAVRHDLALVTASHANRMSASADTVHTKMVAEDWSKIGTADTILTYSQTDAEAEKGFARIMVAAAREVRDKYMVLISQSYPIGQFCLDSVYMNKYVEREVRRVAGDAQPTDEEEN